jgi:gliding motility-associated-like protein
LLLERFRLKYKGATFNIDPHPTPGFFTFEEKMEEGDDCNSFVILHLTVYDEIVPSKFFSPNGDGVNDVWNIKNIEYAEFTSIEIFDRSGKLLVRYTDSYTPWDGTYRGQNMPSNDYWYAITLQDETTYTGHFTLIR